MSLRVCKQSGEVDLRVRVSAFVNTKPNRSCGVDCLYSSIVPNGKYQSRFEGATQVELIGALSAHCNFPLSVLISDRWHAQPKATHGQCRQSQVLCNCEPAFSVSVQSHGAYSMGMKEWNVLASPQQVYFGRVFSLSSTRFNSSSFCPASPSLPSAVRR